MLKALDNRKKSKRTTDDSTKEGEAIPADNKS